MRNKPTDVARKLVYVKLVDFSRLPPHRHIYDSNSKTLRDKGFAHRARLWYRWVMRQMGSALYRSAFRGTYRAIRTLRGRSKTPKADTKNGNGLRVAFIHNEKKLTTGANHINELMACKLRAQGVVDNMYTRRVNPRARQLLTHMP